MGKSRKSGGKEVEKEVATTSLIDSSKGVGAGIVVSSRQSPPQRDQPGGGYLQTGNPGNKGGGRTPDELRALMREPLAKAIPLVVKMIHDPEIGSRDRLAAVDFLARYSIGTKQEVDIKGRVTLVADTGSLSD